MHKLQILNVSNNLLTGNITNSFNDLTHLLLLQLNENLLTGSLPLSLSYMNNLTRLFLQDNLFHGNLYSIFNNNDNNNNDDYNATSKKLQKLSNIQLSNNQFTGTLPNELFTSQNLISFSAVSNCFHGIIPSTICLNKNLLTLALDGLVCASSCRHYILPTSLSYAYISTIAINNNIPQCIWLLPKLQVLHLSGNGLKGSLPSSLTSISSNLNDLTLSHNLLVGTIPDYIQNRIWKTLELSNNRLSGTLSIDQFSHNGGSNRSDSVSSINSIDVNNNVSISLTNNRLSGKIPSSFQSLLKLNILEGNKFTCSFDRHELSSHDSHRSTYECGSNIFNILCYLWLSFLMFSLIMIILFFCVKINQNNWFFFGLSIEQIWYWLNILKYMKRSNKVSIINDSSSSSSNSSSNGIIASCTPATYN